MQRSCSVGGSDFSWLPVENCRVGPGSRVGLRREEEEAFFVISFQNIFFN